MFSYLQKFSALSDDLKARVSSPTAVKFVEEIEKKYGVSLASFVMKVMVKEIPASDLSMQLALEYKLEKNIAEALAKELLAKVFAGLEEYLGVRELGTASGNQESGIGNQELKTTSSPIPVVPNSPMPAGRQEFPIPNPSFLSSSSQFPIPNSQSPSSNFFFSAEDEEEINQLAKKVDGLAVNTNSDLDEKIDQVLRQADIRFGSQVLADRFKQIIKTYLKGIRGKVEVRSALTRSLEDGGLGFDQESADQILLIASGILAGKSAPQIKAPVRIAVPEDQARGLKTIGARDVDYDLAALARRKIDENKKQCIPNFGERLRADIQKLDTAHELPAPAASLPPLTPAVVSEVPAREKAEAIWKQVALKRKKTVDGLAPINTSPQKLLPTSPAKTEVQKRVPTLNTSRPRLEDVKTISRVMGPIEELKYLNLTNFRRLGKNGAASAAKILEKLKLLEDERYSKKLEGINAWRQSPTNKIYLIIGQASISQNKPIDVIIKERQAAGLETLSTEEFEAVLGLNRQLRY